MPLKIATKTNIELTFIIASLSSRARRSTFDMRLLLDLRPFFSG